MNANDILVPSDLNIGETYESATWRIHRFATSIRITHIADAGKRGKKCVQIGIYARSCRAEDGLGGPTMAIVRKAARDVSPESMIALAKLCETDETGVQVSLLRGVEVQGATDRVEIDGTGVEVRVDSRGFSIRDKADVYNESTMIQVDKTGPRRVLAWAKAHSAAIQSMTFPEVTRALEVLGVRSHFYCAVD